MRLLAVLIVIVVFAFAMDALAERRLRRKLGLMAEDRPLTDRTSPAPEPPANEDKH